MIWMMHNTITYLPVSNYARHQHRTGHRTPCKGPVAGRTTSSPTPSCPLYLVGRNSCL